MKKIKEDHIGAYAAQSAMFLIMSIIPFLLVLISFIRFTPVSEALILTGIDLISPGYVSSTVITIVDEVYHNTGGILIVSLIFAVYSAAKTIQSLRYGLNRVYEIEETRNWFSLRLRAMAETFALILAVLLLMVLLMFGQSIQDMLVEYAPFVAVVTAWVLKLRPLILFFVLTVIFAGIYKEIPNRKASFRSQIVGAFGCSAAWYVFTFGVSIYINYFNGFSFYGSMTSIVLLMFWLYFAMYIFLVCGAINSSFEVILDELKVEFQSRRREKKGAALPKNNGSENGNAND
ncbi:MAG: YihY/virulence factor BrkB family protein [Clostridiales bacterium]|nr:YihY/virulence factor BrkB family protein [Clostridiales bacterium]